MPSISLVGNSDNIQGMQELISNGVEGFLDYVNDVMTSQLKSSSVVGEAQYDGKVHQSFICRPGMSQCRATSANPACC
jgi:hypothetical protein